MPGRARRARPPCHHPPRTIGPDAWSSPPSCSSWPSPPLPTPSRRPRPTSPAPPDPLAQLVGALARLPATTPVRARVEHQVTFTQGDEEKTPPAGTATATASSGPEGLRVTWSPSLLARAEAEERERLQNPDAFTPTRDAVGDLRTLAARPRAGRRSRDAAIAPRRPGCSRTGWSRSRARPPGSSSSR